MSGVDEVLVGAIEQAIRTRSKGAWLVLPATPFDQASMGAILTRFPDLRVLLADDGQREFVNRPHAVRRYGPHLAFWDFPKGTFRNVLVIGARDSLGLRALLEFLLRGVRRAVFISSTEPTSSASIAALVFIAVLQRRRHVLYLVTRAIVSRLKRVRLIKAAWPMLAKTLRVGAKPAIAYYERSIKPSQFERQLKSLFGLSDGMRATRGAESNRVVLAIGTVGPGGSERQVVNTALALASNERYQPIVICSNLSDSTSAFYRSVLEAAGVELVDLKTSNAPQFDGFDHRLIDMCRARLSQAAFDIADDTLRFLNAILAAKPAVVHAFLDDTNVKAGVAAVLAGVPRIVLSFRSVAPNNFALHTPFMRPAYGALTTRPEVVFSANSDVGAGDYRKWLGKDSLPITIVRNGIDFNSFFDSKDRRAAERAKYGIPPEAQVLGGIMRMSEEKQPMLWAEAALDISRRLPNVHFMLVGDGPLRPTVIDFLNNGRIGSRIHLPGHVKDIPSVLQCMDVFLLTSRLEGLPNVLIEAQAMGVPVVTTPAGGAVEALHDGVTGLVCRHSTVEGISEACIRILADPGFCQSLSKAGAAYVRQEFSIQRMLRKTLASYNS